MLVTVKITVPVGALRFDSVNLRSVAVTVTRVVTFEWAVAARLGAGPAARHEDACGGPHYEKPLPVAPSFLPRRMTLPSLWIQMGRTSALISSDPVEDDHCLHDPVHV